MSTITQTATIRAILASGAFPHLSQPIGQAGTFDLRVPLAALPAPSDDGWDVSDTGSCLVGISLHRDVLGRTVYLVIDRDNAPLTGNYKVAWQAGSVTYNATTSTPSDVDALLAGIVALLRVNGWDCGLLDTRGAGDDCIRMTWDAGFAAGTYATEVITSSTSFPVGAALVVYGEAESITSATLYVRASPVVDGSGSGDIEPYRAMLGAWHPWADLAVGSSRSYLGRHDLSGLSQATIVAVVTSALDTYPGATDIVAAYILPSRES